MTTWHGLPFLTKRKDTTPFDDDLQIESAPGSNTYVPLDLTGATVKFLLSDLAGTVKINKAATFRGAASEGKVRCTPTAGEMDLVPGDYRAEWEITFPSGQVETIPPGASYRRVIVGADLG